MVPHEHDTVVTASNMLKIPSLLNPSGSSEHMDVQMAGHSSAFSPPPTPALTSTTSTASFSPCMDGPELTPSAKRLKLPKGEAREKVNYPPFESTDDTIALSPWLRDQLDHQHRRFQLSPSGSHEEGLIADYTHSIPYSSDKKEFFEKTGRKGFEVFKYRFIVPTDPEKKEHIVVWDYNTGLTRITPFFKACKYSKTTPAKALNANPGLKEMSYSITGGVLATQGYWMPYACARAMCLTFAMDIRWALTPIFGSSFIRECYPRDDMRFGTFKIDAEIIHYAQMAMENLKTTASAPKEIPRSMPTQEHTQRRRPARPVFKLGSPFDSESEVSTAEPSSSMVDRWSALNSPAISPTNTTFESSGWTTINQQGHNDSSAPPSPPNNTSTGSVGTLLQHITPPKASYQAIRSPHTKHAIKIKPQTATKRTRRSSSDTGLHSGYGSDIDIDKPTTRTADKQASRSPYTAASSPHEQSTTPPLKKGKVFTAEDFRAANMLLRLKNSEAGKW